jgi:hypothetical protein
MDIAPTPIGPRTRPSNLPLVAAAWSVVTIALGLWWWLRPAQYPFTPDPDNVTGTLLDLVPPTAVPPAVVGAGLAGLVVASLARSGRAPGLVLATSVVWALVLGLAVPGFRPLTLVGYLMAMFGPLVLFATVLAGAWRWRGGPMAVGGFVLVGALAWATGIADGDVLRRYAGVIGATVRLAGPSVVMAFFLGGALVWGVLGARTALRDRVGERQPSWASPESAARWGKVAAVVAVVCALPYGLLRMTWLTPWPFGMDPAEFVAVPEMRLHGLLLGLAALAGAVLTTGLVARWGEVWPSWMPVVRGRPVPLAAAVVPGGVVAALFTAAAVPMTITAIASGDLWGLVIFPFIVWGPALGIAVLGYALRRREGVRRRPGTIEGS